MMSNPLPAPAPVSLRTLMLGGVLLLGACTRVGPEFAAPAPPVASAGYGADGAGRAALGESPAREWWKSFGSPVLDEYVGRALAGNHGLAASIATLERAQQRIAALAGRKLPQVDASGSAAYQRFNFAALGLSDGLGSGRGNPEFDLYTAGVGVSYDLDLFGRNARALEQAGAEAEAQLRATQAAHLTIAARVTAQVLALAALNDLVRTERDLLAEDERNVALTEARRRGGEGTMVEVLSAQGQLAADRLALPALEQQIAEGRAMLAVLLGISPGELGPTDFGLDAFTLPRAVPVALPSALVRQRPDIREAEARLHAATAAVGIATADLYPDVTLGLSVTQSTSEPGHILSSRFNAFDFVGAFTAPIFHGGTLKAGKRGAEAEARAAAARYRQVVTEAFGQVASLLAALDTDARALEQQGEAARIAERSLQLSRRSFQVGHSGVLQVLDASRSAQRARLALAEARARQYQNVARLQAATAGGWLPGETHEP